MTGKQIEAAKKLLPSPLMKMTSRQRRLREELDCRDMINSCLIYGSAGYDFYNPHTGVFGQYAEDYVKTLGKDSVIRLFNEQHCDFSKAVVRYSVYTDREGCTYNSCKWEDEQ
jgi:hypothetical protein